ncbi:hypothetical protein JX265_001596 [Neoarthrinium moseri]|uniref:Uncharacterized protein n=1 Tax=Neoarthrinium moseri TaxID=1658444 RepID=A0A9P9WVQ8_9PEZI|nr:uncharacterized protein JN550_003991 [Neoarthrinium moseri]KAI1872272.1 hypothetical protein JN550_003991 [Neoarthrinium moseri]KAI1879975.1 hypothetical protein JX265_001596 [Neoarthrinium moseri]
MAEEPTLPTLPRFPAVSWNSGTQSFNNTRKRVRGDGYDVAAPAPFFSNSSDPAVFSSDDDPSLENYTQGRHRKKRYVGSWYQQQQLASSDSALGDEVRLPKPTGKRTFQRTADSGVWMGSDASTDLEDAAGLELPQPAPCRLPQLNVSRQPAAISENEEFARDLVYKALENGEEDVNLTSIGLEDLSNATITPLSEFACIPTVTEGVPFVQRDPSLKIYLAQNPLRRAPGALFNLEFLTVLSLRNTKITELSPSLGNLRNLKSLNVSLCRLRCLPGELLELMTYPSKLEDLLLDPNPFYQPDTDDNPIPDLDPELFEDSKDIILLHEQTLNNTAVLRTWLDKRDGLGDGVQDSLSDLTSTWRARIVARSPVQFMNSRGAIISKFHLPSAQSDLKVLETEDLTLPPSLPTSMAHSSTGEASRVPSLLELALKSCSQTSQLPLLPAYLPDDAPPHLSELLRRIVVQQQTNANLGDLPCSNCRRRTIMPVGQWVEWWYTARVSLATGQVGPMVEDSARKAVPYMKRACSLGCLPQPRKVGAHFPGTVRTCVTSIQADTE